MKSGLSLYGRSASSMMRGGERVKQIQCGQQAPCPAIIDNDINHVVVYRGLGEVWAVTPQHMSAPGQQDAACGSCSEAAPDLISMESPAQTKALKLLVQAC